MTLYNASVEYGIHCLLFLVDEKGGNRESSVRTLAKLQGVPPELLAKVFTRLAKASLMATTEGVCDGFRLVWPANEISMLDVVRVIDGDRSVFECCEVRERCAILEGNLSSWATHNTCSIHAMILTTQKRMEEALTQQTILDLIRRVGYIVPLEFDGEVLRWMDTSREGHGGPHGQPLAHTERHRKPISWKTPLSTTVLIAPAFLPTLSPEAAAERLPIHRNGP